jgi:hypothetical protein
MAAWSAQVLDVKGAFLHGLFEDGEETCMKVPRGFKKHHPDNVVLLLLRTLHGLKQSAYAFWKQSLMAFKDVGYPRSNKADPWLAVLFVDNLGTCAMDILG